MLREQGTHFGHALPFSYTSTCASLRLLDGFGEICSMEHTESVLKVGRTHVCTWLWTPGSREGMVAESMGSRFLELGNVNIKCLKILDRRHSVTGNLTVCYKLATPPRKLSMSNPGAEPEPHLNWLFFCQPLPTGASGPATSRLSFFVFLSPHQSTLSMIITDEICTNKYPLAEGYDRL